MGVMPWEICTEYEPDLNAMLRKLRHREFLAEYANGQSLSPGEIDDGIAEVIEEADADGTCSILDIDTISTLPDNFDHGEAHPLSKEQMIELLGTEAPSKTLVDAKQDSLYALIDRGMALYVILYKGDVPSEVVFYGKSYD